MQQGVIKKLVTDRGFGFISGDRNDVFFHLSAVTDARFDDLYEGQHVEYELDRDGRSGRGPRASVVRPV